VSFYNETLGEGIYPTPVLGIVGLLENAEVARQHAFLETGRSLVLLRGSEPGDETDAQVEFGSSEYAKEILGQIWGFPPALEMEKEAALQNCLIELAEQGLMETAHDCSDGGLAVAVAESAFPRELGVELRLKSGGLPSEYVLFGEDASRVVISCVPEKVKRIQEVAVKWGIGAEEIGSTVSSQVDIRVDGRLVVSAAVQELKKAWESALQRALESETEAVHSY
jgi:phosphoribosylformylglycinamidine synthase